ncbi:GDSL-type esterase/lipase family protein [Clostridium sp. AM58-1XD]|uniref:SGNH/GDSL hydrolase family protein n=1 Tax=Clostridium sp. AM58-1XD TaxID=2292307 RepID=UPI0015F6E11D|nr:GDSL-type esterase/lipase family protein [Clostridium sp. AM58-1XD]
MEKELIWKKAVVVGLSAALLLGAVGFPVLAGVQGKGAEETSVAESTAAETSQAQESETVAESGTAQEVTGAGQTEAAESQEESASQAETSSSEETAASEETTAAEEPTEREVAESEIDAFFADSVLVGDSVMMGYRNYCMKSGDGFLKSLNFLASGSYSVHNALWPVSKKSVHPIYQGAQRPVWESIALMQKDKVFMFFGLNDLNMGDDTCERYQEVINNIKQLSPDAQFYIISMTYTLRGKGRGKLNNNNIRVFNAQMQQMAAANGWGFVDLATALADANGDLAPAYCSDNYVHQSAAAYQVWTNVLRQYARDQLKFTPAPEA